MLPCVSRLDDLGPMEVVFNAPGIGMSKTPFLAEAWTGTVSCWHFFAEAMATMALAAAIYFILAIRLS